LSALRARKRFGQHFLEPVWVKKVVEAIAPGPGDVFLEVGPGRGALTLALAARGARVVAVEIDRDLAADLAARVPPGVEIVEGDILRVNLEDLVARALIAPPGTPGPLRLRVAGNLPYNVASPVVFRLIETARATDRIADAVLMVQDEVAARLVAVPGTGDYGPLSITVQLHSTPRRLLTLPPGAFRPVPAVRSALVSLTFGPPAVTLADDRVFDDMVRAMFTQRRKVVANALSAFARRHGVAAGDVLAAAHIDGRRRPETLNLSELARLAACFPHGRDPAVL
jgi:16S rRNA (adenine1518-N6/adenine1519-N6)-dimethyltransferase